MRKSKKFFMFLPSLEQVKANIDQFFMSKSSQSPLRSTLHEIEFSWQKWEAL